jgi:hypothetical protein
LTAYQVSSNEIEAVEIVTADGKDAIRDYYLKNPQMVENSNAHY